MFNDFEIMMCNKNHKEKGEHVRGLFTNGYSFKDTGNVIVLYNDDEIVQEILSYDSDLAKEIIRKYNEW